MQKNIIFLAEMPITNGVIQAQMLPIAYVAKKHGFGVHVLETIGRFGDQENERKKAEKEISHNKIGLQHIFIPQRTALPSILYFSLKTYTVMKKIINESDSASMLIYARNYKFLPIVLFAKYNWKIDFIYSPRAAYYAERKFYKKTRDLLFAGLIKKLEKMAFRAGAATIVETKGFREHLKSTYKISGKKMSVIPNYWSEDLLPKKRWNREAMRQKLGYAGKRVVVYAGTLEVWYDFPKMFELVSKLKKRNPDLFFQLFLKKDYARTESVGMLEKIHSYAAKYGFTEKKDFDISSYPPGKRYEYLSACDIGLCLAVPYEFKTTMLYLKIVDYWGSKLPIIINADVTEAKKAIQASNAGAVVDYEKWEESVGKIEINDFLIKDKINWDYVSQFSSEKVLPQYLTLFDQIFSRK